MTLSRLAFAGLLAVALAALAISLPSPEGAERPLGVELVATDGAVAPTNSRDGAAALDARGLRPGDTVSGSVTIRNPAEQAGGVQLSSFDLADAPGAGGGVLSSRLRLRVEDVSEPEPVVLYEGPLAGLGPVTAGLLDAGGSKTYRLSAHFPEAGAPDDDRFQGASAQIGFLWTTTHASSPPADLLPLRFRARVDSGQRIFTTGILRVEVTCERPCRVTASSFVRAGRDRLRLPVSRTSVASAQVRKVVRIRIPRRALRLLSLPRRLRAIHVTLRARDTAGAGTTRRLRIRIATTRPKASAAEADAVIVVGR